MIRRRSFLAGILAAAAGPAIVHAESLMKLPPRLMLPKPRIVRPFLMAYGSFGQVDVTWETSTNGSTWTKADGGFLVPPLFSEGALIEILILAPLQRWEILQ